MGAEEGTRDMTLGEIEEGADKLRAKGGNATQMVVRAGALVGGAPSDASGRSTNKAAADWLFMGAERGTRDMTWEQIEVGADKLRGEGGALCKTAASWKRKSERGMRTGNATKAACLAKGQDDIHFHACILPECGMFCSPECRPSRTSSTKTGICFRHLCLVAQKTIYGLRKHMCRKCRHTAAQCRAAVCTYIACSRPQKFCEYLHAQEDAMKTCATEASALQIAGSFSLALASPGQTSHAVSLVSTFSG